MSLLKGRSFGRKKIKLFDVCNNALMLLICFITLYPIWYVVILSFNDGKDAVLGSIYWWPRIFTLKNYEVVFQDNSLLQAFAVSVARTLCATAAGVFFTAMVSYALSKRHLIGRGIYVSMGIVTIFFGGGLIPYFILIKDIGLYNNFLVYVIPAMFSFYNVFIYQSFFRQLPPSVEESALIDGCNDFIIFVRIILPLSKPLLATMALFAGVYHWNDYFMGVLFVSNNKLLPIQTVLFKIIAQNATSDMMLKVAASVNIERRVTPEAIKLATMVITTVPVVLVYPFLQKYFVKGILLGSIKG